jgi:hypothetical protein
LDRADVAAVEPSLAPGFVHFRGGPMIDRETMLARLEQRKAKVPYIAERTWDNERVLRKADALVFTGRAREVQGGNEIHGGYLYGGWPASMTAAR